MSWKKDPNTAYRVQSLLSVCPCGCGAQTLIPFKGHMLCMWPGYLEGKMMLFPCQEASWFFRFVWRMALKKLSKQMQSNRHGSAVLCFVSLTDGTRLKLNPSAQLDFDYRNITIVTKVPVEPICDIKP